MAKKPVIKPTTMRIRPDLLKRVSAMGRKEDRSRTYKVNEYIEQGLARDERKYGRKPSGALD